MIIVNMPLKRDVVKDLISTLQVEGHEFSLVKEEGIKLYYEDTNADYAAGAKEIKNAIKEKLGGAFYFNVEVK